MATAFEQSGLREADISETVGMQDIAIRLVEVTDNFCRYALGDGSEDMDEANFKEREECLKREFNNCVTMLRVLDHLAANLSRDTDMDSIKAVCLRCVGLDSTASLEKIRQALADLQNAVIHYYNGFLSDKLVGVCSSNGHNAAIDGADFPDFTNKTPTNKMLKKLKNKKIALERIPEILSIICNKLDILFSIVDGHIKLQQPNGSLSNLSLHLTTEVALNTTFDASKEDKKIFYIAQYVLNKLQSIHAHKFIPSQGESYDAKEVRIYTPILHDGISTGVYRPGIDEATKELGMSLEAFVYLVLSLDAKGPHKCPKELAPILPMFSAKRVADYIARYSDNRFPLDDPNPHLIAFTNGTLNILTMNFSIRGLTPEAAAAKDLENEEVNDIEMQYLEKAAEIHAKKMEEAAFIEDHLYASSNNQPCLFVPSYFAPDMMKMSLAQLEDMALSFQKILEHQQIPNDPVVEGKENDRKDVRDWFFALIGRSMIMFHDRYDKWQIALFLLGCAGTGKSTILNLIQKFFPPQTVKAMEDDGETTFGLMAFVTSLTRLIVGSEIPLNMPFATVAKAISHEGVSTAIKNKGAVYINPWIAEFMFAGNGMPTKGNNGGRMTRRFVIIPFDHPVRNQESDLEKHMNENLPAYIMLCARAYNILGKKYGKYDFWNVAPSFFKQQAKGNFVNSNSLAMFLSSPTFSMDEKYKDHETPWSLIAQAAIEHAGAGAPRQEMIKNLDKINRTNACNSLNLEISDKKKRGYYACGNHAKHYTDFWVKGIVFTDENEQQQQQQQ